MKLKPYGDPIAWREACLVDRLKALVQHYCTGPCGQSQQVGEIRSNTQSTLTEARTQLAAVTAERDEARQWVRDLQSGMYINCVYCGHRYGPKDSTPASMADVLKQHIERCPQHPLSLVTVERDGLREACSAAWQDLHEWKQLAEYQREVIDQNRRACPTQAGIDKTSQVLNLISNALAATEPKGE